MKTIIFIAIIASITNPLELDWHVGLVVAVTISAFGALFDIGSSEHWTTKHHMHVFSIIGLSAIAGTLFFSLFRLKFEDSLQAAAISGVCGIYGRRYLQRITDKLLEKFGG